MKLFRNLLLFAFALTMNSTYAQNLMNIHQGNGTLLQIPLESIDSVRFYTIPPPTIQKIFQSNGNILSIAVSDIDSITYTIPNSAALASISTQAVTVLSSSSAYSGGTITSDGGSTITQRGVCWSNSPNPTLANNFSVDGTGIGSYGSNLAPLQSATTYYVRAYAVNSEGTAYGNQLTFTTSNPSTSGSLATITTANVTYIDGLIATCGGNITADGGLAVTSRGVCWAIDTTPTINNSITVDGTGGGSFSSTLSNLLPNTSYFVRAYATNDAGTTYGIAYSFTTHALPTLTTNSISNINTNGAISGGNILSDGGSPVTERGVCWSTSQNPTTLNTSTFDGFGTGSFTSNLTGLSASTTFYVRAYAINSIGTSYGNQQSFTLIEIVSNLGAGVTYNGYTYSSIILGNGQEWMSENLRTANYRNGDPISTGLDNATWISTTSGSYSIYNNIASYNTVYGKLYNWFAVADPRHLCPTGWHEPTDSDWSLLTDYIGGEDVAGGKMKSLTGWNQPNMGATNESGFSGIPGGYRDGLNGLYSQVGANGSFWSSTEFTSLYAWYRFLPFNSVVVVRGNEEVKQLGLSVRCIKD
jgi:uncharacterized protein (TIGR02145 family)